MFVQLLLLLPPITYLLEGSHIHWRWLCVHGLNEAAVPEVSLTIKLLRLCQQLLQVCALRLAHWQTVCS